MQLVNNTRSDINEDKSSKKSFTHNTKKTNKMKASLLSLYTRKECHTGHPEKVKDHIKKLTIRDIIMGKGNANKKYISIIQTNQNENTRDKPFTSTRANALTSVGET